MALLLDNYKEWAFGMYPAMNFKDIVLRTQCLSSKSSVKGHLQQLRDRRDGVGNDLEEDAAEEDDIDMAGHHDKAMGKGLERIADDDAKGAAGGGRQQTGSMSAPMVPRPQQRGPPVNDPMGFGGDPMDMMGMDFGGDPAEEDIARQMYG